VARAEAYLRATFHLDPSNRLATVHQRHRQDRTERTDTQTGQTDNSLIAQGEPFYKRFAKNGSPKNEILFITRHVSISNKYLSGTGDLGHGPGTLGLGFGT